MIAQADVGLLAGFERALRSERELVPRAVEESLRLEPPVLFLFRTARREVELPAGTIRTGERVILGIASGNRDESVYPDPDAFRMERWPGAPEHLTFGPGPHLCLGNALFDTLNPKQRAALRFEDLATTRFKDPIFENTWHNEWIDHILYTRCDAPYVGEAQIHKLMPDGQPIWKKYKHASDHYPVSAVLNV